MQWSMIILYVRLVDNHQNMWLSTSLVPGLVMYRMFLYLPAPKQVAFGENGQQDERHHQFQEYDLKETVYPRVKIHH